MNIAVSIFACTQPEGFIENNEDCNDENEDQSPQSIETCNTADDDCDGIIDNNAIDPMTFYLDADGDGYGVTNQVVINCTAPTGHVDRDGDCDDSSSAISPIASEY